MRLYCPKTIFLNSFSVTYGVNTIINFKLWFPVGDVFFAKGAFYQRFIGKLFLVSPCRHKDPIFFCHRVQGITKVGLLIEKYKLFSLQVCLSKFALRIYIVFLQCLTKFLFFWIIIKEARHIWIKNNVLHET